MLQARTITKERFNLIEEIISSLRKIPFNNLSLAQDIFVEFFDEDNEYHNLRIDEIHLINDESLAFFVDYLMGTRINVYLTDEQLKSILEELELFYSYLLSKDR
jgi:hypothetical protein